MDHIMANEDPFGDRAWLEERRKKRLHEAIETKKKGDNIDRIQSAKEQGIDLSK